MRQGTRWILPVAVLMMAATTAPSLAFHDGSDRPLTRALQDALRSRSDLAKVNGVVCHGVVYLRGTVSTASQRAAAEQVARQATKTDRVYNAVQVGLYSIYD